MLIFLAGYLMCFCCLWLFAFSGWCAGFGLRGFGCLLCFWLSVLASASCFVLLGAFLWRFWGGLGCLVVVYTVGFGCCSGF